MPDSLTEQLIAYLDSEVDHWFERNADRYWQTVRIRGFVRRHFSETKSPEGESAEEANQER